ncbi:uncharacterized protein BDV14DRAFT_177124 [Aspergillus stella-maris]|uniref:uncharacterized protein n=1 Tax=Aspergillus stella-maris TaxID=1810926 RepID=UPI003CCCEBA5
MEASWQLVVSPTNMSTVNPVLSVGKISLEKLRMAYLWARIKQANSGLFAMLSQVERLFISPSRMDVRIHLCKEPPVYSCEEDVAGYVIIDSDAQIDVSSISIKLSGVATSRLRSGKLTESHQLVRISERLFPPTKCAGSFSRAFTAPRGEHVFPFSIKLPQAAQCHRLTATYDQETNKRYRVQKRLPPSTGKSSSPEEIKYTLETTIRQDGLIGGTKKASRDITLAGPSPLTFQLPAGHDPQSATKRITCNPDRLAPLLSLPTTYEVKATLLNGTLLIQGQPISLAVELKGPKSTPGARFYHSDASLHDFQSMLLEATELRARGTSEINKRSIIVQTVSNLREPFLPTSASAPDSNPDSNAAPTSTTALNNQLWTRHPVSESLSPTFETCNISRTYTLIIRLGIKFGVDSTKIVEFQFPVQLLAAALNESEIRVEPEPEPRDSGIDVPAPEYREKEVYTKEVEVAHWK